MGRESVRAFLLAVVFVASGTAVAQDQPAEGDEWDEYYDEEAVGDVGEVGEEVSGELELDTDDLVGDEEEGAEDPDADTLRGRRDRGVRPMLNGEVGLLHVATLDSGPPNSFRVGLHTEYFSASDFLLLGDDHTHIGATLGAGYTPIRNIEIYLSLASYANSNNMEEPGLFQVLGDTVIGAKGGYPVIPWWAIGGDFGLYLLNQVGDIGVDAASFGIRGLTTMDFEHLSQGSFPMRAHLNMGYYFDNSSVLVEDAEARRSETEGVETEITRQERFALGINRTDRFDIGLGLDVPLEYVVPFVEWTLGIPVNRQGYDCLEGSPGAGSTEFMEDSCLAVDAFSAFPDKFTLGARILPPVRGLGVDLAVDIGVTGVSAHVRELAATPPYMIYFGVSYNYDTRERIRTVTKTVTQTVQAPAAPAPPKGHVRGRVRDAETGAGVANAVLSFPGRDLTALSTGADGAFLSYELDPGEVQLHVTAQDFFEGDCAGTIPEAGGDVEVDCQLRPTPKLGSVSGRVADENGMAVAGATIAITGTGSFNLTSSADGRFEQGDMPPGEYAVRVEREEHMVRVRNFTIEPRGRADVDVMLRKLPRRPRVRIQRNRIRITRQVRFQTDSAELHPDSESLLDEVANVLHTSAQIRKVEIQGHTDNRGGREHNQTLSQARAESVRSYLLTAGIAGERLEARGLGQTRPLGPNITGRQRARNRRVEFHILEQD